MQKITFVTGNDDKAREVGVALGAEVERVKLDLDEIQSLDLKAVVEHKARQAYAQLGAPVVVEDVSLAIAQLGGLPGPFIKWFLLGVGVEGVARLLTAPDRSVSWTVGYGYCDQSGFQYAEGASSGTISQAAVGQGGFGFDSIFIFEGETRTIAELSPEEKAKHSPRVKALLVLRDLLEHASL